MLLDMLHIVIGKTQIEAVCRRTPERMLLYKTTPIRLPTDRYNGTNKTLTNIETLSEF